MWLNHYHQLNGLESNDIQAVILRRIFLDPVSNTIQGVMDAKADGAKAKCDQLMKAEQARGDEWVETIVSNLSSKSSSGGSG